MKVTVGYVLIPTLATCAYSKIAEVPVGTSYNFCSPGVTGTATERNLFTGAIAIYFNASIKGVNCAWIALLKSLPEIVEVV